MIMNHRVREVGCIIWLIIIGFIAFVIFGAIGLASMPADASALINLPSKFM